MFKGARNENGRPVGSKNKSTALIKNTIASILDDNVELFEEMLLRLNDKDFVRTYMDLAKYVTKYVGKDLDYDIIFKS